MIKNFFCHYELMNNDVTIELGQPEKMHIHHSHDEAGDLKTFDDLRDYIADAKSKQLSWVQE